MPRIVVDAGHGITSKNGGTQGYLEHHGMWILSNYLKAELGKYQNTTVVMTRSYEKDPSLFERGQMAKGADWFVSNHSNADVAQNTTANGVSVYRSVNRPNDHATAEALAETLSKIMGNRNRGAKYAHSSLSTPTKPLDLFGVIRSAVGVGCPHVFLIEHGFHTNLKDERFLLSEENLKRLAQAQADIIASVLNLKPKEAQNMTDELERAPHAWEISGLQWLEENGYLDAGRHKPQEVLTKGLLGVLLKRITVDLTVPTIPERDIKGRIGGARR